MIDRIHVWWDSLRTALWPLPLLLVLLSVLLFSAASHLDSVRAAEDVFRGWWLHRGRGGDARNLLSTLLTAIITMSSLVFSITIVAISLAANQFGSRLIRTYISNVRTKLALGFFVATIVYCLLALGAIEEAMTAPEVPHITVTVGSVLSFLCVLVLLFFLHNVARSMVADEVIRRAAAELEESISALQPIGACADGEHAGGALPPDFGARAVTLPSLQEGYVQAIDHPRLVRTAAEHDLVVRLELRPGTFMCKGGWLAAVHPPESLTADVADEIQRAIVIGRRRTPTQDLEFSLRHVVDIALRALSPGINDSNTALVVIDHLRGALSRLMGKSLPDVVHRDENDTVRVVSKPNSYGGVLDAALHQIRQAAAAQPAVIINLLGALGRIAEHVSTVDQRDALLRHAELAAAAGLRKADEPRDRDDIEEAFRAARDKINEALELQRAVLQLPQLQAAALPATRG